MRTGLFSELLNFQPDCIKVSVSCFLYSRYALIDTDVDQQSPALNFITFEEQIGQFSFHNPSSSFKFPFYICESNGSLFVADNERHYVFKPDVGTRSMTPVVGVYDQEGKEDVPAEIASPSRITSSGFVIYIAEHSREYEGSIRIM